MMLNRILVIVTFSITLHSCSDPNESEDTQEEHVQYAFEDIQGQWTLIQVDTIVEKQSLEQNKGYPLFEYTAPTIEPVDGVLKCVYNCPDTLWPKEIEFANDSVFEYSFPKYLAGNESVEVVNNQLILRGYNSVWYEAVGDITISMSANLDTLRVEFLEETGLFLSQVYVKSQFDNNLVKLLRAYEENLPYASGEYVLVRYLYESVDYDSPFEHHHSFPHDVPETLDLSKELLLEVLKEDHTIDLLTDGELKPYRISWNWWSDRFWFSPQYATYDSDSSWYEGPDTSASFLYERINP